MDTLIRDFVAHVRRLPPGVHVQSIADSLSQLNSRSIAALVKQLADAGLVKAAWDLFNWLRAQPLKPLSPPQRRQEQDQGEQQQQPQQQQPCISNPMQHLCNVYLYTAMISLCNGSQQLELALELNREMASRGIERNVHTFSALMNVCIKAGHSQQAMEVYRDMQAAGCTPNLVTYNTLIDLHGKTGQWAEALRVLERMRAGVGSDS
jgi:pentatricopeptide repeat domain-containing protein 1